jgi:hypothetical protein
MTTTIFPRIRSVGVQGARLLATEQLTIVTKKINGNGAVINGKTLNEKNTSHKDTVKKRNRDVQRGAGNTTVPRR